MRGYPTGFAATKVRQVKLVALRQGRGNDPRLNKALAVLPDPVQTVVGGGNHPMSAILNG